MLANGIILFALLTNARKGTTNNLIANQTIADLYSCVMLLVSYALKIPKIYLTGIFGDIVCKLVIIDGLVWIGLITSVTSLVLLTLERYFKIVYPMVHRKHFRPWMTKAAVLVTWPNGVLRNVHLISSARVSDGECASGGVWNNFASKAAYGTAIFSWDFVIPMVVFIYCYTRILRVVRSTMSAASDTTAAVQSNSAATHGKMTRSTANATRTLVTVSATFAVCWAPMEINRMLMYTNTIGFTLAYHISLGIAFLNTAINPLIYAAKYQPVRKVLGTMFGISPRRTTVQPVTTTIEVIESKTFDG